jgi:hypothetical protein
MEQPRELPEPLILPEMPRELLHYRGDGYHVQDYLIIHNILPDYSQCLLSIHLTHLLILQNLYL